MMRYERGNKYLFTLKYFKERYENEISIFSFLILN